MREAAETLEPQKIAGGLQAWALQGLSKMLQDPNASWGEKMKTALGFATGGDNTTPVSIGVGDDASVFGQFMQGKPSKAAGFLTGRREGLETLKKEYIKFLRNKIQQLLKDIEERNATSDAGAQQGALEEQEAEAERTADTVQTTDDTVTEDVVGGESDVVGETETASTAPQPQPSGGGAEEQETTEQLQQRVEDQEQRIEQAEQDDVLEFKDGKEADQFVDQIDKAATGDDLVSQTSIESVTNTAGDTAAASGTEVAAASEVAEVAEVALML